MIAADEFRAPYDHVISKDVVDTVARLFRAAAPTTSLSLRGWESPVPAAMSVSVMLQPAFERLAELARLDPDWDSYGALPTSPEALEVAKSLLITVMERFGDRAADRAVPCSLMPIVDGGVQIEWRGPTADLELNVGPDRRISFVLIARHADGRTFSEGSDLSRAAALDLVRQVIVA